MGMFTKYFEELLSKKPPNYVILRWVKQAKNTIECRNQKDEKMEWLIICRMIQLLYPQLVERLDEFLFSSQEKDNPFTVEFYPALFFKPETKKEELLALFTLAKAAAVQKDKQIIEAYRIFYFFYPQEAEQIKI